MAGTTAVESEKARKPSKKEQVKEKGKGMVDDGKDDGLTKDGTVNAVEEKYITHFNKGNKYMQKKQYGRSIEEFNKADTRKPKQPMILNNRGVCFMRQARACTDSVEKETLEHKALYDFNQALQYDSKYINALLNRASLYEDLQGQHDLAMADYSSTLSMEPRCAAAYYNRANLNHRLGQLKDALEDYRESFFLNPQFAPSAVSIGNIYMIKRKYADAINWYTNALFVDKRDIEAVINRALAYSAVGKKDEAEADFQRVMEHQAKMAAEREVEMNKKNSEFTKDEEGPLRSMPCDGPEDQEVGIVDEMPKKKVEGEGEEVVIEDLRVQSIVDGELIVEEEDEEVEEAEEETKRIIPPPSDGIWGNLRGYIYVIGQIQEPYETEDASLKKEQYASLVDLLPRVQLDEHLQQRTLLTITVIRELDEYADLPAIFRTALSDFVRGLCRCGISGNPKLHENQMDDLTIITYFSALSDIVDTLFFGHNVPEKLPEGLENFNDMLKSSSFGRFKVKSPWLFDALPEVCKSLFLMDKYLYHNKGPNGEDTESSLWPNHIKKELQRQLTRLMGAFQRKMDEQPVKEGEKVVVGGQQKVKKHKIKKVGEEDPTTPEPSESEDEHDDDEDQSDIDF